MQHDLSRKSSPALALPKCLKCGNYGYTNCERAKQIPQDLPGIYKGGDYITIAFQEGTACDCPAGQEFAAWQMEWNRPDKIKHKNELSPSRRQT